MPLARVREAEGGSGRRSGDAVSPRPHVREQKRDQMSKAQQHLLTGSGLPSTKSNRIVTPALLPNLIQNVSVAHINPGLGRQVNWGKGSSSVTK